MINRLPPLISVVIVVRNTREHTRRCLRTISESTPSDLYEVIVVDNASSDGTARDLERSNGIRMIRNEENLGFGAAVNMGVATASGRHLLLLNSDAFVEPGWWEPMLEEMETHPDTAAVVPMVLNPDGSLQESAVLVSGDGRTIAHGSGGDANDPAYQFPRYVDYGSALCMLVRRVCFQAAGGFDPAYGQGYCEDVDLCFRFAEMGWRVRYEPRSRVRHIGGASSDPETIEALVRVNTRTLRAKWPDYLSRRPPLSEWSRWPHRLVASRDVEALDRVLVAAGMEVSHPVRVFLERSAGLWPAARLTLLMRPEADESPGLLDLGVEVIRAPADMGSWFRERLLHYSMVVIDGAEAAAAFGDDLHHTQPQALCVYSMDTAFGVTVPRATEVRQLRRSDAVWSTSDARLAVAADLAPQALRFLMPADGWATSDLPGVMAHLGIAPPGRRKARAS